MGVLYLIQQLLELGLNPAILLNSKMYVLFE